MNISFDIAIQSTLAIGTIATAWYTARSVKTLRRSNEQSLNELKKERFINSFYRLLEYQRNWRKELLNTSPDKNNCFENILSCFRPYEINNGCLEIRQNSDYELPPNEYECRLYFRYSGRFINSVQNAKILSEEEKKSYLDIVWSMTSLEERSLWLLFAWNERKPPLKSEYFSIIENAEDEEYAYLLGLSPNTPEYFTDTKKDLLALQILREELSKAYSIKKK